MIECDGLKVCASRSFRLRLSIISTWYHSTCIQIHRSSLELPHRPTLVGADPQFFSPGSHAPQKIGIDPTSVIDASRLPHCLFTVAQAKIRHLKACLHCVGDGPPVTRSRELSPRLELDTAPP